jgi:hypothetical protein
VTVRAAAAIAKGIPKRMSFQRAVFFFIGVHLPPTDAGPNTKRTFETIKVKRYYNLYVGVEEFLS